MDEGPLFTRNFVLCTLVCLFHTVMFFMFYTGMSSYARHELGCSTMAAGLSASTFVFGSLISRILLGRRMELIGKKRLCILLLSAGTLVCLLYFLVCDLAVLTAVRLVHGLTYGAMASAVNTFVVQGLPASRRGEGMGYFMLSVSIGSAVGPLMCMWLQRNGTYGDIFAVGTAANLLALICCLFLTDIRPPFTREQVAGMRRIGLSNVIERSALPISVVIFVFFFSYSGVLTFISPYGAEIGLETAATFLFVFISAATFAARIFGGKIYDRNGEDAALIPFFLLFAAGMAMLSRADSSPVLLAAGLLMGFNVAQSVSVGQALAVRRSAKERYGVAVSTFNVFLDLAYGIGPAAFGLMADGMGYRDSFLAMAFLSLVSLMLYVLLHAVPERRKCPL